MFPMQLKFWELIEIDRGFHCQKAETLQSILEGKEVSPFTDLYGAIILNILSLHQTYLQ